jgi:hypothetical protein
MRTTALLSTAWAARLIRAGLAAASGWPEAAAVRAHAVYKPPPPKKKRMRVFTVNKAAYIVA